MADLRAFMRRAIAYAKDTANAKAQPMIPDIEALRLAARRRAALRRGGRTSTILSQDRLGP